MNVKNLIHAMQMLIVIILKEITRVLVKWATKVMA